MRNVAAWRVLFTLLVALSPAIYSGQIAQRTGIRRIQELVVDPLFNLNDADESGDSEVENAAAAAQLASPFPLDGSANPMDYEQAQLDSPLQVSVYLEREYLWGPGNRGVDELLVQFDHTAERKPWWVIQDDGGDVVAVCDTMATGTNAGKGRVVQQLTYDAYGEALSMASFQPHPVLRCGHKGLFVDRLDVGVMSSNFIEFERIVPFGQALSYNRNRTYSSTAGRFLQADPNMTGSVVLGGRFHGAAPTIGIPMLDMAIRMGDGASLYAYLGSSPHVHSDAMGLSWQEDYEAVLLPIMSFADNMMPVSIMGPLDDLLRGYVLMTQVHAFVQGAAFDAEEELDWAMDLSRPDDLNPRFASVHRSLAGPNVEPEMPDLLIGKIGGGPHPNQIALGKRAEGLSRDLHGSVATKRYTSVKGTSGKNHRRKLDNRGGDLGDRTFMEVKAGKQELTWRVRRQILIDMRLKNGAHADVDDVQWEFWVRDKGNPKEVAPELLTFLKNCNIKYSFQQLPK